MADHTRQAGDTFNPITEGRMNTSVALPTSDLLAVIERAAHDPSMDVDRPLWAIRAGRRATCDVEVDPGCGPVARKLEDFCFPLIGIHARLKLLSTRIAAAR